MKLSGVGIRKLFNFQKQRFFPMPDYDFSDGKCKATITGKILNEDFARILIKNPSLSLEDTLILDKVQKQKTVSDEEFKYLKKQQFIEGRKPNIFLSSQVIEPTEDEGLKANYIRNKGFDDDYSKKLILEYILKWKEASRKQIEMLLVDKLSDVLGEKSKKNKVMHFLQALRKENKIEINEFRKWRLK